MAPAFLFDFEVCIGTGVGAILGAGRAWEPMLKLGLSWEA